MTEETIRTICWAFVATAVVQAFTLYCFFRLVMTGRGLFERRDTTREPSRIFGVDR